MEDARLDMKLVPKCVHANRAEAYVNTGHILPCCWVDGLFARKEPEIEALFADHLKVENNNSLEDILFSKEWIEFYDLILNHPEKAPKECYKYCGESTNLRKNPQRDRIMDSEVIENLIATDVKPACSHGVRMVLKDED